MEKWEYLELKIIHGEVELVDGELMPPATAQGADPYEYVKSLLADGWQLVTRSGTLSGEVSVVLKRLIEHEH